MSSVQLRGITLQQSRPSSIEALDNDALQKILSIFIQSTCDASIFGRFDTLAKVSRSWFHVVRGMFTSPCLWNDIFLKAGIGIPKRPEKGADNAPLVAKYLRRAFAFERGHALSSLIRQSKYEITSFIPPIQQFDIQKNLVFNNSIVAYCQNNLLNICCINTHKVQKQIETKYKLQAIYLCDSFICCHFSNGYISGYNIVDGTYSFEMRQISEPILDFIATKNAIIVLLSNKIQVFSRHGNTLIIEHNACTQLAHVDGNQLYWKLSSSDHIFYSLNIENPNAAQKPCEYRLEENCSFFRVRNNKCYFSQRIPTPNSGLSRNFIKTMDMETQEIEASCGIIRSDFCAPQLIGCFNNLVFVSFNTPLSEHEQITCDAIFEIIDLEDKKTILTARIPAVALSDNMSISQDTIFISTWCKKIVKMKFLQTAQESQPLRNDTVSKPPLKRIKR